MSRARIIAGVWTLQVTWAKDGVWRTDMFKSVLADHRLEVAEFILVGGPSVRVLKSELERVLVSGPDHYNGAIWGPFDIEPRAKRLGGTIVSMDVVI